MRRRRFLLTSLPALLAARRACAQPARPRPTVGILRWVRDPEHEQALRAALRDLHGGVDGRSIAFEERWADGHSDVAVRQAVELVGLGVDVLVAAGTPAVHAAVQATRTVPIVMFGVADPVASGFAASLARPGGNVTGNSWNLPALAGKRLQLLREALPDIARVAFLGSRRDPAARLFIEETQRAGRQLGVQVHVTMVSQVSDFDAALAAVVRERVAALIVQPIFGYGAPVKAIVDLTRRYRLPSISDFPEFAVAGGLLSYGPSRREAVRRVAAYVDAILKGARPGELPIEEPRAFDLVVNLETARILGVTIPGALLARADRVIR